MPSPCCLAGGRTAALVRPGASRAVVEGAFEVPGAGLRKRVESLGLDLDDGRVVVRREVSTEGRSRAWVNGSPTTATVLGELGAILVDLHGQHETESLLRPDAQRDMLDAFAGAERERAAVADAHATTEALTGRGGERSRSGATKCAAGPTTCGTWWPRSTARSSSRARRKRWSSRCAGSRRPAR